MPGLDLQIANNLGALCAGNERVREFLGKCAAPTEAAFLAELVIEELVTNTIKYGYDDDGEHVIRVSVRFEAGALTIEVRDDGHAFNPLEQANPDFSIPAEERPIGGLGLHLVRQMTDEVRYERQNGENVVVATKTFVAA
jgi:anti-sigma regulatory factor (Ser/Thr protein kinase)